MNIGQICSRPLVKVPQNTPVVEVASLMSERHVGAVVVTHGASENAPIAGILTDRDIVSAQLEQARDLATLSAGDVMTRNVLTLAAEESIGGAIAHMHARGVRRAPVVSANSAAIGIVSTDDLIAQLSRELLDIAGIVVGQPRREPAGIEAS